MSSWKAKNINSPPARLIRSFEFLSQPMFWSRGTSRTLSLPCANPETISNVLSLEQSSLMRISKLGHVCAARLSRVREMNSAALKHGTSAVTLGCHVTCVSALVSMVGPRISSCSRTEKINRHRYRVPNVPPSMALSSICPCQSKNSSPTAEHQIDRADEGSTEDPKVTPYPARK